MNNNLDYRAFFNRVFNGKCQCQTDSEICWPCEASLTKKADDLNMDYVIGTGFISKDNQRDSYHDNLERLRKHTKCAECGSWNVTVHIPPTCALSHCNDCGSYGMAWDEQGRPDA